MLTSRKLDKYIKIEEEINSLNSRKFKSETRKRYKRYYLKFAKVLIENNIQITSIKNIKNEHLKFYGELMLAIGRNLKIIMEELRGVVFWYKVAKNGFCYNRYTHLMYLRILQKYLEEQEMQQDENYRDG